MAGRLLTIRVMVDGVPWGFFFDERDGTQYLSIPDCGGMADMLPRLPAQLEWLQTRLSELPERDAIEPVWEIVWKLSTPAAAQAVRALLDREGGESVKGRMAFYAAETRPSLRPVPGRRREESATLDVPEPPSQWIEELRVLRPTRDVMRVMVEGGPGSATLHPSTLLFAPEHREWLAEALRRVADGSSTHEGDEAWSEILRVARTEHGVRASSSRRSQQAQPSFSAIHLSVAGAAQLARQLDAPPSELFVEERSAEELTALLASEDRELARRAAEEILDAGAEVTSRLSTAIEESSALAPIWDAVVRRLATAAREALRAKDRSAAQRCELARQQLVANDRMLFALSISRVRGESDPDQEWSQGSRHLELRVSVDSIRARSYDNFVCMVGAEQTGVWEASRSDPASTRALSELLAWHEEALEMLQQRATRVTVE